MKDFLEKTLRQNISMEETEYLNDKLPLTFRGRYIFFKIETNGHPWIAIYPKIEVGLVTLRKDRLRIEKLAGLNCAIFLDTTTFYIKEKFMEEGIPFVIKNKQVYLPFIGFLLSNTNERDIPPVHLISYLTQKLIFTAIYEKNFPFCEILARFLRLINREVDGRCRPLRKMNASSDCGI